MNNSYDQQRNNGKTLLTRPRPRDMKLQQSAGESGNDSGHFHTTKGRAPHHGTGGHQ